jgi:PAS domain S-box-containing protein
MMPREKELHHLQALLQSENRFRASFQASPDAVALVRINDSQLVDINESFTIQTGYHRAEVIGKSTDEIRLWPNEEEQKKLLTVLRIGEPVLNMESSFRHKQGRIKTGLVSAMIITKDSQPHILLVIRDIDALKKTKEALEISEARFRELFNNMSSGVAIYQLAANGRIVMIDCNRAAEHIEKLNKNEWIRQDARQFLPDFQHGDLEQAVRRVGKTGKSEHHPVARFQENALLSWKEYYIYKLQSGEIITVFDDITERKIAEEKLLDYQEELRTLTSELSLAEERERRSIATELHDQIGQTLTVLHMKLQDLQENIGDANGAAQVADIREGLKSVIQETRSLTFELSPPVLYELGLEAALEWLGEQFQKQHGLQWSLQKDGQPKPLAEDVRIVLFRSVRELLVNVIKHAHTDRVWITSGRQNKTIRITVADKGVGFDARQTAAHLTKKYGFGLFNIRERLNHLGGQLHIDSRPGRGARVALTAPLKL